MTQNTSQAVMAQRTEPQKSPDYFPTPAWGTRALLGRIPLTNGAVVWEPAAGGGHMAEAITEAGAITVATDLYDHGAQRHEVRTGVDFLDDQAHADFVNTYGDPSWIITNPPFNRAEQFILKAFDTAADGVAILARSVFTESVGRYDRVFGDYNPDWVLQFSERLPMHAGSVKRRASTATAYAWFVWERRGKRWGRYNGFPKHTMLDWIPPGSRARLERLEDYDDAESAS